MSTYVYKIESGTARFDFGWYHPVAKIQEKERMTEVASTGVGCKIHQTYTMLSYCHPQD
jgi:hypothetical protein